MGDAKRALDSLDRADSLGIPLPPSAGLTRAEVHLFLGELDAAEQRLATLEQDAAYTQMLLGRVAEARGEREPALLRYRNALSGTGAGVQEARWRLAAVLIEQRRVPEADALLEKIPAIERLAPAAVRRVAAAERSVGLEARARTRVSDALALRPQADDLLAMQRDGFGEESESARTRPP